MCKAWDLRSVLLDSLRELQTRHIRSRIISCLELTDEEAIQAHLFHHRRQRWCPHLTCHYEVTPTRSWSSIVARKSSNLWVWDFWWWIMQSQGRRSCLKLCWNLAEPRHWRLQSRLYNKCRKLNNGCGVMISSAVMPAFSTDPSAGIFVYFIIYIYSEDSIFGHHSCRYWCPTHMSILFMKCRFLWLLCWFSLTFPFMQQSHFYNVRLTVALLYMLSVCSATTLSEFFHAVARERGGWHGVTEWSYKILPACLWGLESRSHPHLPSLVYHLLASQVSVLCIFQLLPHYQHLLSWVTMSDFPAAQQI